MISSVCRPLLLPLLLLWGTETCISYVFGSGVTFALSFDIYFSPAILEMVLPLLFKVVDTLHSAAHRAHTARLFLIVESWPAAQPGPQCCGEVETDGVIEAYRP